MKTNFFRRIIIASIVAVIAIVAGFVAGCQREGDEPLDDAIISSSELEEYIIAASDLKQSLAAFEKEMGRVDFSKLEVSYDRDGRKTMRLPASVGAVSIEEKVRAFNEKKEALLGKYPQFVSCSPERIQTYFQQCVQSSQTVSGKLLKMGINFSRPVLKSGSENNGTVLTYANMFYLQGPLYAWMFSSNYVELFIIAYADGTYATYQHSNATSTWTEIGLSRNSNGNIYFRAGNLNSPVIWIGHTHLSGPAPYRGEQDSDYTTKKLFPEIGHWIYYDGLFYNY
jgi:hypothetical protein